MVRETMATPQKVAWLQLLSTVGLLFSMTWNSKHSNASRSTGMQPGHKGPASCSSSSTSSEVRALEPQNSLAHVAIVGCRLAWTAPTASCCQESNKRHRIRQAKRCFATFADMSVTQHGHSPGHSLCGIQRADGGKVLFEFTTGHPMRHHSQETVASKKCTTCRGFAARSIPAARLRPFCRKAARTTWP